MKDSCLKVGWTGKEKLLQREQHLVLGKCDGSARAVGVIRCLHINIRPSSGNHLQRCWESLGTAHDANGTSHGDWFLFLPFFPRVMENSCLKQLKWLLEGIQIYAAIFLKPEFSGARHWKILW